MDDGLKALEKAIEAKVEAGVFPSAESAVQAIIDWLEDLERRYIEDKMHNEDA